MSRACQPQSVNIAIVPGCRGEEIRHLLGQIPTADRATINNDEFTVYSEPCSDIVPADLIKPKSIKVRTTWGDLMCRVSSAQAVPFTNYWPYTVGQSDNAIRREERSFFHVLGETKRDRVLFPMPGIDI